MNTPTQAQAQAQVHAAAPTAQTTVGLASFNRSRSTIRAFFKAWPPLVLVSLAWLATMLTAALLADWLMPYGFTQIDLRARLQPPVLFGGAWNHVLGTDELGRDVLSRTLSAIQVSLLIAFSSTVLSTVLGVTLGILAAHFRGKVENLVLVLIDFQASMPFMIIALAVLAFFGNTLLLFIVLMGFYGWERAARIARSLTIAANEQGYAAAAHDLGASIGRVYGKHVLPNIAGTIIVNITITFPGIILLESGLSFLGLGVQPPMASLGNMVGYGREYLQSAPWILLVPSLVIVLTTFSMSLVGDWLRDRLDPSLR